MKKDLPTLDHFYSDYKTRTRQWKTKKMKAFSNLFIKIVHSETFVCEVILKKVL